LRFSGYLYSAHPKLEKLGNGLEIKSLVLYVITIVISLCIIKELVTGELQQRVLYGTGFCDLTYEEIKTLHTSDVVKKSAQEEGSVSQVQ